MNMGKKGIIYIDIIRLTFVTTVTAFSTRFSFAKTTFILFYTRKYHLFNHVQRKNHNQVSWCTEHWCYFMICYDGKRPDLCLGTEESKQGDQDQPDDSLISWFVPVTWKATLFGDIVVFHIIHNHWRFSMKFEMSSRNIWAFFARSGFLCQNVLTIPLLRGNSCSLKKA